VETTQARPRPIGRSIRAANFRHTQPVCQTDTAVPLHLLLAAHLLGQRPHNCVVPLLLMNPTECRRQRPHSSRAGRSYLRAFIVVAVVKERLMDASTRNNNNDERFRTIRSGSGRGSFKAMRSYRPFYPVFYCRLARVCVRACVWLKYPPEALRN
jgi:hypothetical protein